MRRRYAPNYSARKKTQIWGKKRGKKKEEERKDRQEKKKENEMLILNEIIDACVFVRSVVLFFSFFVSFPRLVILPHLTFKIQQREGGGGWQHYKYSRTHARTHAHARTTQQPITADKRKQNKTKQKMTTSCELRRGYRASLMV